MTKKQISSVSSEEVYKAFSKLSDILTACNKQICNARDEAFKESEE